MDDWALIKQYVGDGSQTAFAAIVNRHMKMVYTTCLRDVNDAELAQDLTQAVFILLAQKASTLHKATPIRGWLFLTARFVSKNAIRKEIRRRECTENMKLLMEDQMAPYQGWIEIEPMLNDALASLSSLDREAVLMRYFDDLSIREIGAALGMKEGSARTRLSRAINKLRSFFQRNGTSITSASLTLLLGQNMTAQVPLECHTAVLHAVQKLTVTPVPTGSGSAHFELIQKGAYIAMQTSKYKYLITATVILLMGGITFGGYKGWQYHRALAMGSATTQGGFTDLIAASPGAASDPQATDKLAIDGQFVQLTNGVNSHNLNLLRLVIAPDASFDQTKPPTGNAPYLTRDQELALAAQDEAQNPNTKYSITLKSLTIQGDQATGETHITFSGSQHRWPEDDAFHLVKRQGTWLITTWKQTSPSQK